MIFAVAMQPLCAMLEALAMLRAFDELSKRLSECALREEQNRVCDGFPSGASPSDRPPMSLAESPAGTEAATRIVEAALTRRNRTPGAPTSRHTACRTRLQTSATTWTSPAAKRCSRSVSPSSRVDELARRTVSDEDPSPTMLGDISAGASSQPVSGSMPESGSGSLSLRDPSSTAANRRT